MKTWEDLKWWNSPLRADLEARVLKLGRGGYQPLQFYKALNLTPFDKVRVVIIGQDPYPKPGMATGLAFSVSKHNKLPPTLYNIFRELENDLHIKPAHGDLTSWATQGVLLWNSVLTVQPGKPNSHKGWGWETLTTEVISAMDEHLRGCVFVLWGKEAQQYLPIILPSVQDKRHHVILSAHPSPLSARRGFFGSRPFSTINGLLKDPIDWRIT